MLDSHARPRIALNAQLMRLNEGYRSAGIARYIYQLLRALPDAASDFDLVVFSNEPRAHETLPNLEIRRTRWPARLPIARIFWEQLALPFQIAAHHLDLLHSLAFVLPLASRIPSIVTVYDTSFLLYPEYFRLPNRFYLRWGTRFSVQHARRVIAISESTKRDLVKQFQVPAEKIDVIPPGVEPEFFVNGDPNAVERFRHEKKLPDHFLLFVGTLEPRKNIPTLIRAFAVAKRREKIPHHLVIAGGRGWMDEAIPRTVEEMGLRDDVTLAGFVPQTELRYWYQAADAFVYPSQYEGFGMPPLEALAAGTPVITTNVSSLPEAVGDATGTGQAAALLVEPRDERALADALVQILRDNALRETLRARGIACAREFTWKRAAELTAQTYRRAFEEGAK